MERQLCPNERIPSLDLNQLDDGKKDLRERFPRPALDDPAIKQQSLPTVRHYNHRHTRNSSTALENNLCDISLTNSQNAQMRSSPPIQPNEHAFNDKLPSFSEFLDTTRAHTPPRTPSSRRQGSSDSSPYSKPQFDEVAWKVASKRRNDTLGDIYEQSRPVYSSEAAPYERHRLNSVADLSNHSRTSSQAGSYASDTSQHQRPSYPYPPPHASTTTGAYGRQQSSPPPPTHSGYRQSSVHHGLSAHSAYAPPQVQSAVGYDRRPSYYPDGPDAVQPYSYGRSQDAYYGRPPFPGAPYPNYETNYSEVRFHNNVGIDQNSFSRKRRGNLPKDATNLLKGWFANHRSQPYPTEDQKIELCQRTNLTMNQVSNWFINARRRAPQKEAREREANGGPSDQM
ncbi:hypothetical protein DE146DRAFT_604174 [Phaeosphaeria sp. MPI-PUGE-AT-0046c]|nr:hypothetical protein DE146DRAFT_604174 [Phaeosphaeria sp. MPI-PUGE-AT-0046c]